MIHPLVGAGAAATAFHEAENPGEGGGSQEDPGAVYNTFIDHAAIRVEDNSHLIAGTLEHRGLGGPADLHQLTVVTVQHLASNLAMHTAL